MVALVERDGHAQPKNMYLPEVNAKSTPSLTLEISPENCQAKPLSFLCSPALPFVLISSINCSLAHGPGDTQEGSLWLSLVSVVPAMSVIPSAGLALPGSRHAPLALLQTHSGLTLVEQEWPQSRLEASAPSPGPCSLCASSKGSPMFCHGHEECPAAPLCSQWEKSLLWAERE